MRSKLALLVTLMGAQTAFAGLNGVATQFKSPNGVSESCVIINKLPAGKYSPKDIETEKEYCSMDLYNSAFALCPKTWSTSPGVVIRDNSKTGKSSVTVEPSMCAKDSPLKSIAKFKTTMSNSGTSGTYSWSSILYYHLSRVLDTTLDVPVAVYRTMDKDAHYSRVATKAKGLSKMNVNGWEYLKSAAQKPESYIAKKDLLTADMKQFYGALVKDKGERYGVEINGTRVSAGIPGQHRDMQKTPAFLALKSPQAMPAAIDDGVKQALKDPAMAKAFASEKPSETQVVLWMREMSEMAILDFIMSQQDRVGNIDFRWYWVYQTPDGKIETQKVDSEVSLARKDRIKVPSDISTMNPVLVQKTMIGDNDAGGLPAYANPTKGTQLLESLRHMNPETYRRLYKLASDFGQQGPNYQALAKDFALRDDSFKQTIANTKLAASILLKSCEEGKLHFDLVSYKAAYQKRFTEETLDCRNP